MPALLFTFPPVSESGALANGQFGMMLLELLRAYWNVWGLDAPKFAWIAAAGLLLGPLCLLFHLYSGGAQATYHPVGCRRSNRPPAFANIRATGRGSAEPITVVGREDRSQSRRVVFKIRVKSLEQRGLESRLGAISQSSVEP